MTRWTSLGAITLICLLTAGLVQAADDESVGRWNITVEASPRPYPSWLKVELKDGKHVARFLGRSGSVGDIGEIKFDKPKISFKARKHQWTGTIKGDTITGECVNEKGDKSKWVAKRSVYKIDLNGMWWFHAPDDELFETKTGMRIIQEDEEEFEGGMEGLDREVSVLEVGGDKFIFYVDHGFSSGESGRGITVTVKGDKMVGTVTGMDGTESRFVAQREREWGDPIELFNGKNLDGWKPLGKPKEFTWKVIDGVMVNTAEHHGANIVSEKKFGDFKAHIEFKVPKGGNSGIYLRGRHEIQVHDSFRKAPSAHNCGALYSRITPATNASRPADQWQTFDITFTGSYLTVMHNGRTIIDNAFVEGITGGALDSHEDQPGPFYLQGDHSSISYRKITITPAKAD